MASEGAPRGTEPRKKSGPVVTGRGQQWGLSSGSHPPALLLLTAESGSQACNASKGLDDECGLCSSKTRAANNPEDSPFWGAGRKKPLQPPRPLEAVCKPPCQCLQTQTLPRTTAWFANLGCPYIYFCPCLFACIFFFFSCLSEVMAQFQELKKTRFINSVLKALLSRNDSESAPSKRRCPRGGSPRGEGGCFSHIISSNSF